MVSRVGLAVMRLQPLHKGHCRFVINPMIEDCEVAIIALGSAQESRTQENPYTIEQRMQMIRNVYADRVKIVPLNDIQAVKGTNEWVTYVVERIKKLGLPEPTDYYSGSLADASWYADWFSYSNSKTIHVADRANNEWLTATEIRALVQLDQYSWLRNVPAVNIDLIEKSYPSELKVYMG